MSFFTELNTKNTSIMDGRERCEAGLKSLVGGRYYIDGADVINSKNGLCAVLTIAGQPDVYYFGGKVITDKVQRIKDGNQLSEISKHQVEFVEKESKSGQTYFDMVFSD